MKKLTPQEIRTKLQKACEDHDYDPFEELIKLATEKQIIMVDGKDLEVRMLDADQRITIAKELASYMAPKLKNVEVKGEISGDIHISITNFAEVKAIDIAAETKQIAP